MLRLFFISIFIVSFYSTGYTQDVSRVDYGFSFGVSNYLGDIGGAEGTRRDGLADMKFSFTRWTLGGMYRYTISPTFAFKGVLNCIRLAGDDAKTINLGRRARNLNFKNDIFEFSINTELYLFKINELGNINRFSSELNLYLTFGLGIFYSNPKGQNNNGGWVSLQPLQTEGVSYNKLNFVIPLGLGFYYTLSERSRLGFEMIWRTTFTDYIDDISTFYANDYDGISNKTSPELLNQINQENEVEFGEEGYIYPSNFQSGSKRGDPDHNDSYMTVIVNFSWNLVRKKNMPDKSNGIYPY